MNDEINSMFKEIFEFGDFPLTLHKSNPHLPHSPFFCNLELIVSSFPSYRNKILEMLDQKIISKAIEFDYLVPVPFGANHWVAMYCRAKDKEYLIPDKKEPVIGGLFEEDDEVIIIEDVITSGVNAKRIAKMCKENGLKVQCILTILDREQGGVKWLEKIGYKVYSLFTVLDILSFGLNEGWIKKDDYEKAKTYVEKNKLHNV